MNDWADNGALDRVAEATDRQRANGAALPAPTSFTLYRDIDLAPRKDWLVHNFLGGAGEQSVAFGAPGSAKSALAVDLTAHVAAQREWFGRRVQGGAVLYVAIERIAVVKRRLAAWRLHRGLDDIPLAVIGGQFDLRSSHIDTDKLVAAGHRLEDMTGDKLVLVVVETINRGLAGGDENSPKDMGALIANLARLGEATGAHVLSTHHIPADGTQRLRGHGALLGFVDTTIRVEKLGDLRAATVDKTNDGEEGERVVFDLQSVDLHHDDETGITTTAPVVIPHEGDAPRTTTTTRKLSDRQKRALEALDEARAVHGRSAPASLLLPTDVFVVAVDQWRDEMFSRGVINRTDKNPRAAFQQIRDGLGARHLIAERDGLVWKV